MANTQLLTVLPNLVAATAGADNLANGIKGESLHDDGLINKKRGESTRITRDVGGDCAMLIAVRLAVLGYTAALMMTVDDRS
jgi:hypothetical protein